MESFDTVTYRFINYTEASQEDIVMIWKLRNLEDVRKWMVNGQEIPLKNHLDFVKNLGNRKDKAYFIIKDKKGDFIGSVNISIMKDRLAERGIFINPDFHNQGHASKSMKEFYDRIAGPSINRIFTKVKVDNKASNALEKNLGARLIETVDSYNHYLLEI